MSGDTRQRILQCAQALFNERGYNGVSMQDIASAAGISKGNLTYHFAKKEAIVETLLAETRLPEPTQSIATLRDLDSTFITMQHAIQSHAFYFLNYAQLGQISEKIFGLQSAAYQKTCQLFAEGFDLLRQNGLFEGELFAGEYRAVIDDLYMVTVCWDSFSRFSAPDNRDQSYRIHAWSLVYRLLTTKGREELGDIFQA